MTTGEDAEYDYRGYSPMYLCSSLFVPAKSHREKLWDTKLLFHKYISLFINSGKSLEFRDIKRLKQELWMTPKDDKETTHN